MNDAQLMLKIAERVRGRANVRVIDMLRAAIHLMEDGQHVADGAFHKTGRFQFHVGVRRFYGF